MMFGADATIAFLSDDDDEDDGEVPGGPAAISSTFRVTRTGSPPLASTELGASAIARWYWDRNKEAAEALVRQGKLSRHVRNVEIVQREIMNARVVVHVGI